MISKKSKKITSLFLISIVTVLGLISTAQASEFPIKLTFNNRSKYEVQVTNIDSVALAGAINARAKQGFQGPNLIQYEGKKTTDWTQYAPGIDTIKWQGRTYLSDKGESGSYNATGVTLQLSKGGIPTGEKPTVTFQLSPKMSGKKQTIPFKYGGSTYYIYVTVDSTPFIWEGVKWDETYYTYVVDIT